MRTRTALHIISALLLSTLLLASASDCAVIRVKPTGSDSNDGSTWALAKQTVGAAITAAVSGDEIWVAAGTYGVALTLREEVALYGGFAGTETLRTQRNWTANVSTLDGQQASCVVTVPSGCTTATVIDGFTITRGLSTSGGGIYCDGSSPTITNCTITANTAGNGSGGGIACVAGSTASITYCQITGNHARGQSWTENDGWSDICVGSGGNGGGIYCNASSPSIAKCTISSNDSNASGWTSVTGPSCDQGTSVGSGGGIMCSGGAAPTITGCTMSNNQAHGWATSVYAGPPYSRWIDLGIGGNGGGIYLEVCSPTVTSCTLSNNRANGWVQTGSIGQGYGGGIGCSSSSATVKRCTITTNRAFYGGGLHIWGGGPSILSNSISSNTALAQDIYTEAGHIATGALGGGVYCMSSAATIANNAIRSNTASGSYNDGSGQKVWIGTGGGLYVLGGSAKVYNNTVTGNIVGDRSGVYTSSSTIFVNNIISSNSGGVSVAGGTPVFRSNCVALNTGYNFSGMTDPTGTNGNISADPKLSGANLTAASPCINAGDDSVVQGSWTDVNGHARVYGTNVDIGADEFEGTPTTPVAKPVFDPNGGAVAAGTAVTVTCATTGATIRYTTNGAEPTTSSPTVVSGATVTISSACTLKAKAWKTGVTTSDTASAVFTIIPQVPDLIISPTGGSYEHSVHLRISCPLNDPWLDIHYTTDGTEPTESSPMSHGDEWLLTSCTIKAKAFLTGFTPSNTATASYTIRGPRVVRVNDNAPGIVQDGTSWDTAYRSLREASQAAVPGDEFWVASGVYVSGGQYPVYNPPSNTSLYGGFAGTEATRAERAPALNQTRIDRGTTSYEGTYTSGVATIDGVTISGGVGGRALCGDGTSITVNNCDFTGIKGTCIYTTADTATITGNHFTGNTLNASDDYAIHSRSTNTTVANNAINNNTIAGIYCFGISEPAVIANNALAANSGSGIRINHCAANITNNTVRECGTGIDCDVESNCTIANCIIADNFRGVFKHTTATADVRRSCLYRNSTDYGGMTIPPAANDNMLLDPLFVSGTDLHLTIDSPCIDAGDNAAVQVGWRDLDETTRIIGSAVDIGAYEYLQEPPACSIAEAKSSPSLLNISGVVTASNSPGSYFYVEDPSRANGVRVNWTGTLPPTGKMATVIGYAGTDGATGERYVSPDRVRTGADATVAPLALTCGALGGSAFGAQAGITGAIGLNNIGLLVKVSGRVVDVDPAGAYFYIDDGSSIWNARTHVATKVVARTAIDGRPYAGKWVTVTGISSCVKSGDSIERCILVQRSQDIKEIASP